MSKINEFQKYPTDKAEYDKNYLRLYGKKCLVCDGNDEYCPMCNGTGYIKEEK